MTKVLRSSFVRHRLKQAGATFGEVAGGLVATSLPGGAEAAARDPELILCDLSPLPRCGFKGPGAPDWLRTMGIDGPSEPNLAEEQGGVLAVSLSRQERLLLNPLSSDQDLCSKFGEGWSFDGAPGCYPVPRNDTHCWFLAAGECAPDMLAKLCGVDLRPHKFAGGQVAQTSLARISCIVIRSDVGPARGYYLLADSASADYLWSCLEDAMAEFDGRAVGLETVRKI